MEQDIKMIIRILKGYNESTNTIKDLLKGQKVVILECANYNHQDIHIKKGQNLYHYELRYGSEID